LTVGNLDGVTVPKQDASLVSLIVLPQRGSTVAYIWQQILCGLLWVVCSYIGH
jgi:hypothetical protein